MTTLQLTVDLPERVLRRAREAGLLSPASIEQLLQDALRRKAGEALVTAAKRVEAAGLPPLSLDEIQEEVNAVRAAKRSPKTHSA
jgi:hypothetical protein